MALEIGSRLGPYEIQAAIGAGGMGEVYRARDLRLHRDVAIKVLPDALAADPDRLARFEREAQLLAALSHQNVAAIHGLDETGGTRALVLEFVDGPTLAERIARGPIPIDEALSIAQQVADALGAAHEVGITHRDLKPANIKIRPDGAVKVLDFGLAKAREPSAVAVSMAPTITSPALMTGAGVILGTAAYMSPEQARGKAVDRRTDVWAFGCVLYEMLTGRRAFDGPDVTDVLARILEREPDFSVLPPQTPEPIRRLLRRCLQKNASQRLRDIGDARLDIDEARSGSDVRPAGRPVGDAAAWRWGVAAAAGVAAIASGAYVALREPAAGVQALAAHVQIALPPGVHVAVDTDHPAIALSPDGSQLAFVGDAGGERQLYVRDLAAQDPRAIPGTEGAASPFYSPDGAWIGFFDGGLLKKVTPSGGVPIAVHASTPISVNRGATWISNASVLYASSPNGGLSRGSVSVEEPQSIDAWTPVTDDTRQFAWPHALPNDERVLFADNTGGRLDNARVAILSLQTSDIRTLVNGGTSPRYSTTGHLLFSRGAALYAVPFDVERGETTGTERSLLNGVMAGATGAAQYAVAGGRTLAYVAGGATPAEHELLWVTRTGRTEPLLDEGRRYEDPRLSPDGRRLAFTSPEGANFDIWVRDLVRGSNTRVTTHSGEDFEPVWSPDGRRLAFASEIDEDPPNPGLAWIAGIGERAERLLRTPARGDWEIPMSWSPDGRWLAFAATKGQRGDISRDIFVLPTTGARQPMPVVETAADENGATFSPDGRWLAYSSDESGRQEIYVRPFPGPGTPITISTDGGVEPRWSRSGNELFYRNGNRMTTVTITGMSQLVASAPETLFEGRFEFKGYGARSANYDVAADGRFVMVRRKTLVTPTVIHVVFNWPRALGLQ